MYIIDESASHFRLVLLVLHFGLDGFSLVRGFELLAAQQEWDELRSKFLVGLKDRHGPNIRIIEGPA